MDRYLDAGAVLCGGISVSRAFVSPGRVVDAINPVFPGWHDII